MKLAIIADDLTGAADSIAPFASRGMKSAVALGSSPAITHIAGSYDAVAITTETRDVADHGTILNAIRAAMPAVTAAMQPPLLCKKIDSTLRGNPGLELEAMLVHLPDRTPVICPAFPAHKRFVVDGKLVVDSECIASVSEFFGTKLRACGKHINLSSLHNGVERLCRKLDRCGTTTGWFVDAKTDADLRTVARALLISPARWIPVGSAGFLTALASQLLPDAGLPVELERVRRKLGVEPVLFLLGSRTETSYHQARYLSGLTGRLQDPSVDLAIRRISQGERIAIASAPTMPRNPNKVLETLLTGAEQIGCTTMVVTGGATAAALLKRVDRFSHIEVFGEIEPGIAAGCVVCLAETGEPKPVFDIVLKSGSFGDQRTLARIAGEPEREP